MSNLNNLLDSESKDIFKLSDFSNTSGGDYDIDKSKVFKISQNLLQDEANSLFTIDDDSMSPDIQIGDKVILKEISESDLEFGKTYLISTEFDGKTNSDLRKIIKPGSLKPGYGILKPLNPDWAESEVELDKINIVGKVVSVIKDYN